MKGVIAGQVTSFGDLEALAEGVGSPLESLLACTVLERSSLPTDGLTDESVGLKDKIWSQDEPDNEQRSDGKESDDDSDEDEKDDDISDVSEHEFTDSAHKEDDEDR
jgi:hypothetical protein